MTDWRLPENRREIFQRFYTCHLRWKAHPGLVYSWLPAIAERYELTTAERAWLVWLNGNTQNPVTSLLLLEASDCSARNWRKAVDFWNEHFTKLEWDTDRRHQKGKFGEATAKWIDGPGEAPALGWRFAAERGWDETWSFAVGQPYMGRLSAWSMTEYARIMFPEVPDAATLLLRDSASKSHRNGLSIIAGWGDAYRDWDRLDLDVYLPELEELGSSLLEEARVRNPGNPDVSYLTMESTLCTYKSWHKPNRRYPNVYSDMHHDRIMKAEGRFGDIFGLQWDARARALPEYLRLDANRVTPGSPPRSRTTTWKRVARS